jgi:hypothetical protein
VEKMGDVGGKRTIIDPCQHKAVRISVRQALLNHSPVKACGKPLSCQLNKERFWLIY